jgi:hypothetical protein
MAELNYCLQFPLAVQSLLSYSIVRSPSNQAITQTIYDFSKSTIHKGKKCKRASFKRKSDVISIMNRKIITIVLVLIVIGVVGVVAYQTFSGNNKNTELITVTYTPHAIASSDHWYISNSSMVTDIVVDTLFNSSKYVPLYAEGTTVSNSNSTSVNSKDYPLNINDFYLTSTGQPLSTYIATLNRITFENSSSGIAVLRTFEFTVRGNVTSYQLAYNGTQDVKIINSS